MYFKTKLTNLFSLGSANISASLIGGLFWLYLANIVTKAEYGEIGYLISLASIASAISILSLGATILVYEPKKENIFTTSYVVVLISSSLAGFVTYLISQNLIVSLLVIAMTSFTILLHGLLSRQNYRRYSLNLILKATTSIFLALLFYHIFGINGIFLGYFLGSLVIIIELKTLVKNQKIKFSILKQKIKFMLPAYSNRLLDVSFVWGDKLLIGSLFGLSMLGNYFFAAQYLFLLQTIPLSIFQYLLPQESEGKKNKNIKIFSIIIASAIATISFFVIPFFISRFFPNFEESIELMQIFSLAVIPFTISQIQITQFLGKEKSQIVLIGGVFQTTIYLLLVVLLGNYFGLIGIAIGLVISVIIRIIFNVFTAKRLGKKNQ